MWSWFALADHERYCCLIDWSTVFCKEHFDFEGYIAVTTVKILIHRCEHCESHKKEKEMKTKRVKVDSMIQIVETSIKSATTKINDNAFTSKFTNLVAIHLRVHER